MIFFVLLFAAMLIGGRMIREAAARARKDAAEEAEKLPRYRVRIATAASGKPKRRESTERYVLESEIERQRVGRIIDSRSEIGAAEVVVALRPGATLDQLEKLVQGSAVASRATITAI